ncbi:hypothetical protein [Priestia abyssalis]|uniref:hypothetical protein n=1 Tax=Priestia abyssalis TaxID=1221450 RepID=UPI0009957058|nr:hypothetical protein [Priestia abyssalis]
MNRTKTMKASVLTGAAGGSLSFAVALKLEWNIWFSLVTSLTDGFCFGYLAFTVLQRAEKKKSKNIDR